MAEFWQAFQDPGFPFLRYALAAGLLSSVAFGILGPVIVARRISFVAGSISHSMLGGIGLALFLRHQLGWSWCTPGAGALAAALSSAAVIGAVRTRRGEREDTVIAAVWTVGMAAGVLFLSLTPVFVDPMSYLFGNILLLTRNDLWMIAGLDALLLIVVLLLYRPLLAVCFDEEFARIRGLNTGALSMLLFGLTALTVALLLPMVGTVLVIALLTLPAALAGRFTKHLWSMMIAAAAVSAVFAVAGVALSAVIDIPSGAAIVLLLGAVYLIPVLLKRRR
ncbi:metal ABC transporter permease [bacterium]|nr:metal ABC transporter permease [bacterium]